MRLVIPERREEPDDDQSAVDALVDDSGEDVTDRFRLCRCGRVFEPYRSFQRFCSDQCRVKYSKGKKTTYVKRPVERRECKECGREYETNDGKRKYCSRTCYDAYQLKRHKAPEKRHCLVCGTEFETTHWVKRYCSESCRKTARETFMSGRGVI